MLSVALGIPAGATVKQAGSDLLVALDDAAALSHPRLAPSSSAERKREAIEAAPRGESRSARRKGSELDELKVGELAKRAGKLAIEGRSKMTKREFAAAAIEKQSADPKPAQTTPPARHVSAAAETIAARFEAYDRRALVSGGGSLRESPAA